MVSKILIAEDDIVLQQLLLKLLQQNNFAATAVENGKKALEIYQQDPNYILITDLEMPEMDGFALIQHVKKLDTEAIILVQSSHENPTEIIETMKLGVYDYIIKPYDMPQVVIKLNRAIETASLRRRIQLQEKEKVARLENQMEWYQYKEKYDIRNEIADRGSLHSSLFNNLRTNFSQGAGFGVIASMTGLILACPQDDEGNYILGVELIEFIEKNNEIVQKAISTFEEIQIVISKGIETSPINATEIYTLLKNLSQELKPFSKIKQQSIVINHLQSTQLDKACIQGNLEYLKTVFQELFINAMKFSVANSKIFCMIEFANGHLQISVINEPSKDIQGRVGIPDEYQNLVFEPFFRLSTYINDGYKTLDYGLGLTYIEKIIEKHNGKVSISHLIDHLNSDGDRPKKKLSFITAFPSILATET
ncbi:MAG: response regulator [Spirochaetota bacterium]